MEGAVELDPVTSSSSSASASGSESSSPPGPPPAHHEPPPAREGPPSGSCPSLAMSMGDERLRITSMASAHVHTAGGFGPGGSHLLDEDGGELPRDADGDLPAGREQNAAPPLPKPPAAEAAGAAAAAANLRSRSLASSAASSTAGVAVGDSTRSLRASTQRFFGEVMRILPLGLAASSASGGDAPALLSSAAALGGPSPYALMQQPGDAQQQHRKRRLQPSHWMLSTQLSVWNYVLGPHAVYVWSSNEERTRRVSKKLVASASLSGEFGAAELTARDPVTLKVVVHLELELVYLVGVFTAPFGGELHRQSLTLLVPTSQIDILRSHHEAIVPRWVYYTGLLASMLATLGDDAASRFTALLSGLLLDLEELPRAGLTSPLLAEGAPLRPTFSFSDPACNAEFVARAVTAMLQTQMSVVVLGREISRVNAMVFTLSEFLDVRDRQRCVLARPGQRRYIPNVLVQGLVVESDPATAPAAEAAAAAGGHAGSGGAAAASGPLIGLFNSVLELRPHDVIHSVLPTTIIDLSSMTVRISPLGATYQQMRQSYLQDLERRVCLDRGARMQTIPEDSFWETARSRSPLLASIVERAWRLAPSMRGPFVRQSMRLLLRRAVTLTRLAEVMLCERRGSRPLEFLHSDQIDRMRVDLGVQSLEDYHVLAGLAEKLFPGMEAVLLTDCEKFGERLAKLLETI